MAQHGPSRRALLTALLAALPGGAAAQGSLLNEGRGLLNAAPGAGNNGGGSGPGAGLSQGEIGSGLKDALKVASQRVVGRVGKPDGYNGDPAIRIPLPDPLQKIEGPLKSVGAGGMLADLQTRMNRAAEQAAPKALNIFTGAVTKMSITDARSILDGPQDAATQYFKRTTTASLTTSFRPIVDNFAVERRRGQHLQVGARARRDDPVRRSGRATASTSPTSPSARRSTGSFTTWRSKRRRSAPTPRRAPPIS